VVFGYSQREEQDVDRLTVADGKVESLVPGDDDARNPVYSPDGKKIYFVSDRSGIFNLYTYDLEMRSIDQISNVLGGAFMPAVNRDGDVAFSSYTSGGFKLNLLRAPAAGHFEEHAYVMKPPIAPVVLDSSDAGNRIDWEHLRAYDDTQYPNPEAKPYKNIFTSLSIVPFIRVDEYSTANKGLDYIKPGFYFTSSDVLEKYDIFGGAAMNRQFERDLFFIFEYKDRIPGLYQLGLSPTVSLELYDITRDAKAVDGVFGLDTVQFDPSYGLLEFDINFKQNLFTEADVVALGFAHSRYSQDIASTFSQSLQQDIPGSTELYFIGNDISLSWEYNGILPSRDRDINPVGRKIFLRADYELDKFNFNNEYAETESGLSPVLSPFDFPRAEVKYSEYMQLPGWKHTLSLSLRGGTIFGPLIPDFFDFYAGGLVGMKGYPFYALGGNGVATANATYRFPLWENIDLRFLQIYFDKLYGSVHYDYGDAWDGSPVLKSFKRDAGFELRLQSISFYAYPTSIFFNGTYGFDAFQLTQNDATVSYGKEWRFYFGILFGFDLD